MNKKFSVYINKLVINISTFGPIGFFGKAPGTNGSIVGLLLYLLIFIQIKRNSFGFLVA